MNYVALPNKVTFYFIYLPQHLFASTECSYWTHSDNSIMQKGKKKKKSWGNNNSTHSHCQIQHRNVTLNQMDKHALVQEMVGSECTSFPLSTEGCISEMAYRMWWTAIEKKKAWEMQRGFFPANKSNDAAWKSVQFLCSIISQYKIFHLREPNWLSICFMKFSLKINKRSMVSKL